MKQANDEIPAIPDIGRRPESIRRRFEPAAFQTQQDAYQAYLEAKTREKQERKVKFLGGIFSN